MLSRSDIEAIFNQIDKISKLKNNGASLPDELMMKKGDYLEALTDLKERLASIEKLKETNKPLDIEDMKFKFLWTENSY